MNAWSDRSGRPTLAVAVSPSGQGPLAEMADVTVPDPSSLISLLRQIVEDGNRPAWRGEK